MKNLTFTRYLYALDECLLTLQEALLKKKSFGGKVIIKMKDGSIIQEEKEVADAHPSGLRPFRRANYIDKFKSLTDGLITKSESEKFLSLVQNLKNLKYRDLINLNPKVKKNLVAKKTQNSSIF